MQVFGQYKTFWLRVLWNGHDLVNGILPALGFLALFFRQFKPVTEALFCLGLDYWGLI